MTLRFLDPEIYHRSYEGVRAEEIEIEGLEIHPGRILGGHYSADFIWDGNYWYCDRLYVRTAIKGTCREDWLRIDDIAGFDQFRKAAQQWADDNLDVEDYAS